jgi:hypothetical protein
VNDRRMGKLLQALSGRERALLFLREYKDGTNRDAGVGVAFAAASEHREYARLIDLIRVCNNELADLVLILKEQLAQEELRFNAMKLMVMAAHDMWLLDKYLRDFVPEPVTVSEAQRRKEPKSGFVVYDDDRAEDVATQQEDRRMVREITGRGYRLKLPLDMDDISVEPMSEIDQVRLIATVVRDNLAGAWMQLKAVDVLVDECAEDLGDDPLRPQIREALDDAIARSRTLEGELRAYIGTWNLPDDLGDAMRLTRKLVERALK